MMEAAKRWLSAVDGSSQGRDLHARIDRPADGIAEDQARPGVQNDGGIDEAGRQRDIGDIADPELVRTGRSDIPREVREDRAVMIAVGGGNEAPPDPRLQIMLPHQAADLLMVHDNALLAQGCADTAVAVELELVADREHGFHNCGVVGR